MKVLLVASYAGRRQMPVYPLGLACIASCLPDHEVKVIDPMVEDDPIGSVECTARAFAPDVIGISLRNIDPSRSYDTYGYLPAFSATLDAARAGAPGAFIAVGGAGYSLYPEVILRKHAKLDAGVYLDGEEAFPEMLTHLGDLRQVAGLYIREGDGSILFTGKRSPVDMDAVPLPDRHCLDVRKYMGISVQQIGVETHRGCRMGCIYCTYPTLSGRSIRMRSVPGIMADIEALREQGVEEFFFTDPCFNNPPEHAVDVARALRDSKSGMRWAAYYSEQHTNAEFVRLCRDAGCDCFIYGADAGDDAVLQKMGKQLTRRQILDAYATVRREAPKAGLKTAFMLNAPGETTLSLLRTLSILALGIVTRRFEPSFSSIRIYPGTAIHKMAIEEGLVDADDDLLEPRYYNPMGIPRMCAWVLDRLSVLVLHILRFFNATPY